MPEHTGEGEILAVVDPWQDRIPEELIEALCADDELVEFTEEWRNLPAAQQIARARAWLRRALGMEAWRGP